jgi:hypothetical protein
MSRWPRWRTFYSVAVAGFWLVVFTWVFLLPPDQRNNLATFGLLRWQRWRQSPRRSARSAAEARPRIIQHLTDLASHLAFITPGQAQWLADRSAQWSLGRRGCCYCRTASWWRRIKISAVFHVSSRPASRSHAASRVIRRNTNRRHMIGDHHEPSARRATLLVRTVE